LTNKLPSTIVVDDQNTQSVENVFQDYMKWHSTYEEFSQGRTNFQIEKFVSLEDGTPCYNYVNVLYQTRVMRGELMREVKRGIEQQREFEYRWSKHEDMSEPQIRKSDGEEKLVWYDLDKIEHDHSIMELKMSIKDKLQQLETFNAILSQLEENNGGKFTKDQYEQEAPEYWEKRFERQSIDDIISARLGVTTGNVKSIRQALAKPILKDSPNQITADNSLVERLINGDFEPLEAIREGNKNMEALYHAMTEKNFLLEKGNTEEVKQVEAKTKDPYSLDEQTLASLGISLNK
jgi:hypothetical protein